MECNKNYTGLEKINRILWVFLSLRILKTEIGIKIFIDSSKLHTDSHPEIGDKFYCLTRRRSIVIDLTNGFIIGTGEPARIKKKSSHYSASLLQRRIHVCLRHIDWNFNTHRYTVSTFWIAFIFLPSLNMQQIMGNVISFDLTPSFRLIRFDLLDLTWLWKHSFFSGSWQNWRKFLSPRLAPWS